MSEGPESESAVERGPWMQDRIRTANRSFPCLSTARAINAAGIVVVEESPQPWHSRDYPMVGGTMGEPGIADGGDIGGTAAASCSGLEGTG
jgi:hypothetical protein